MDQDAADRGVGGAEVAFQFGDDGVDALHGEVVGEGAVAADVDAVVVVGVGAGHDDVVDVDEIGRAHV